MCLPGCACQDGAMWAGVGLFASVVCYFVACWEWAQGFLLGRCCHSTALHHLTAPRFTFILLFLRVFCLHVCLCILYVQCPQKPEGGTGSLDTRTADSVSHGVDRKEQPVLLPLPQDIFIDYLRTSHRECTQITLTSQCSQVCSPTL